MSDLYREYSRILRDDKFHQNNKSNVSYKRKDKELTFEYGIDKKGKHFSKVYNINKSYNMVTKTWISDGNNYKSFYTYKQYDKEFKEYLKNGLLHRDNKPASVCKKYSYSPIFAEEKWFQEGVFHNSEGPAYFFEEDNSHDNNDPHYYCEKLFFWKGEELDEESYYKHRAQIKRTELTQVLYDCNVCCKDVCGIISSFVW
jgi:hypothetical protein